jgi:nucleoside-diphosphate-sugar epimerase
MAVLVTGGAGFVGMNVLEALLERGEQVVSLDAGEPPPAARKALASHGRALEIETGSVLDCEYVEGLFRRRSIDRVIHAAAVTSGPQRETRDPASIVEVNVRGTINVLQSARKHAVRRVVYVGSGAAYGETLYRLPRLYEESPSVPTTLYSITKHAAERTCMRLKELWALDLVCVRLGTVIGPWERDTGVRDNYGTHSQLARQARAGATALLTPREVQRDWIYSRDVAQALIDLAYAPKLGHTLYNVSSGVAWEAPIRTWCDALVRAFPGFRYRVAQPGEQPTIWYTDRDRGLMDIGRLEQDTGFRPRYPMAEAYAAFIKWIRDTPQLADDVSHTEKS